MGEQGLAVVLPVVSDAPKSVGAADAAGGPGRGRSGSRGSCSAGWTVGGFGVLLGVDRAGWAALVAVGDRGLVELSGGGAWGVRSRVRGSVWGCWLRRRGGDEMIVAMMWAWCGWRARGWRRGGCRAGVPAAAGWGRVVVIGRPRGRVVALAVALAMVVVGVLGGAG